MRVVVAPDKFKGTLTARDASRAMAAGVRAVAPSAAVVVVPATDGGEGFLDALAQRAGRMVGIRVSGPLGAPASASIAHLPGGVAALESAQACGLGLLAAPAPLDASTYGVGDLIRHARSSSRASSIVVGVGGSASTDGGTGAAAALGWRFLDAAGDALPLGGGALARLHAIEPPSRDRGAPVEVVAACDVDNPLVGERGSARTFGPQKGAAAAQVDQLERGLDRLAAVVRDRLDVDVAGLRFAGAGGGLAAGLRAFLGAQLVSGFDYAAEETGLAAEIERADVVVTGEGAVDATTSAGKVVGGVVGLARSRGARAIVVAGRVAPDAPQEVLDNALTIDLLERFGDRALLSTPACIEAAVTEALATSPPP